MTPEAFIGKYYPFARQAEQRTGVPALFALAQSALESGWGKSTPGNMLFGVKVGSGKSFGGWKQDKQLITTTEYSDSKDLKFPYIYPGYPQKEGAKYKYMVKDYFRAYPSPLYTFLDWAGMLSKVSRYAAAMQQKDPYRFADEVAKAGYATDPNYSAKIRSIMNVLAPMFRQEAESTRHWYMISAMLLLVGLVIVGVGVYRSINKGKKVTI